MSEKGFGSKIFGLFVESEGGGTPPAEEQQPAPGKTPPTPAEEVARLAAQGSPAVKVPSAPPSVLPPGGKVDFDAIFREVGMDPAELDRVAKAEQLLRELPQDSSQAVKKQIVETSLRAFGFETQRIVGAAQNQQKALDTYVQVNETAVAHALQDAEAQIKVLTGKISALRADTEKRSAGLAQLSAAAQTRKAQLQKVLDFFHSPAGQGGPPAASDKP